jgi:hypothetical protein
MGDMRRMVAGVVLLVAATAGRVDAQADWRLTLDVGATTFSSAAHDTSTPAVNIRPWRPTTFSLRATRDVGDLGFSMTLGLSNGPLGVNIEDFVLLDGGNALLIELAPEFRYRLVTIVGGASLHLSAGPIVDIWSPQDDDPRTLFGGIGGLTLAFPLAERWLIDIRGDLAVTGSLLTEEEGSPGLIRESTMRRGRVALGITRRL